MATAAITKQINHDVFFELHPIIKRHLSNEQHRFGVITIDVKNRTLHHLGHVSAILSRARIFAAAGSKAHLVVDDDMHGTASGIAACLRHLEGFHHHTLTGKSSIAMHNDRQHLLAVILTTNLTGAHRAFNHGTDDLKMRRVKRQRQMHFATRCHHIRREALVILHITRAFFIKGLAFKFVEQVGWIFTQNIDQQVQTATVGHADDDFACAIVARTLNHLVDHRDKAFATL